MWVDEFQKQTWTDKYKLGTESFNDFCNRISSNVFYGDVEKQKKLKKCLKDFRCIFGGRINANIGLNEEGLTLFNCFIESIVKNPDSLEGIMQMVTKSAVTLKTEGGLGFCANFFRPANTLIRKIGVTTPGSIKFLEIFDKVSEVITSGSVDKQSSVQGVPTKNSIRKGAIMVTMSACHPDIEEFIIAKTTPNRLMRMNMSVLVTDAFVKAIKDDSNWDLWFPDINYDKYDEEWDGNFELWAEKGYPVVIYKTVKARDLWDLLMKNTYNRNEPGILFIDNCRKDDNISYLKGCSMLSSNPCAEVIGSTGNVFYNDELVPIGDICDLGSISLVKYYDIVSKKFNMDKFLEDSKLMVESLDNVIECSNYPLPEYENAAKLKRKIGVGLTAVGSLMMMMNIRYGSNECINFLDDLLSKFINTLYQASALLAKEKGAFPLYDEKILECGYVANSGVLTDETKELVKKYGLRNATLSAIAPNGTLSILAGNVSGGLEPVFAREGYRWYRLEGKKPTFKYPRIDKGEWFETDYFVEDEVSGEKYLISTDGEYRIDKSNGLCKKIKIRDYGYNIANENGFTNVATATELSVEEHLNVLSVFAKYIDQSCSKTINLPSDITFDDFKKLYTNVHSLGIKGCTTYREGSSVAVLESEKKHKEKTIKEQQEDFLDSFKNHNGSVVVEQNVSLPEEYPARGYILRSEGKKWYLHVAFKDKSKTKPFAMFVNTNAREDNVPTFNALEKLEALALHKGLRKELVEQNKQKFAYQKNPVKICRTLGFLLRHNVDVYEIVKALDEVEEADVATFVFRIKKFLAQFVDRIDEPQKCPACGEYTLVFQEGCFLCTACGSSKCS